MPTKTWTEYEALVLSELKRLHEAMKDLRVEFTEHIDAVKNDLSEAKEALKEDISEIRTDVSVMKVKSGLLGTVSGAVSSLVVNLSNIFHK